MNETTPQTRIIPGTDLPIIPRRLLIVEDHESTATVMQRLLQRHGHEVWIALSYQEALRLVHEHRIEVLICDLDLPDGDGRTLLQELKREHSIHGIVVSGHGDQQDVDRSRAAGFVAHLVKPFDITQIEMTLAEIFPANKLNR